MCIYVENCPLYFKKKKTLEVIISTLVWLQGGFFHCLIVYWCVTLYLGTFIFSEFMTLYLKFADDTTAVGLIGNNSETCSRQVVQHVAEWCANNNQVLNTPKTKRLMADFRRSMQRNTWCVCTDKTLTGTSCVCPPGIGEQLPYTQTQATRLKNGFFSCTQLTHTHTPVT